MSPFNRTCYIETFKFGIIVDFAKTLKLDQRVLVHPSPSFPNCSYFISLWYICHNEETNIDLLLSAKLQILLGSH